MASTHPKLNPGRLISLVDYKWRTDRLPHEDIVVPAEDMPDPDAENVSVAGYGGAFMNTGNGAPYCGGFRYRQHETLRELERRWNDLALYRIHRGSPVNGGVSTSRPVTNPSTRAATTSSTGQTTAGTSSTSAAATGSGL